VRCPLCDVACDRRTAVVTGVFEGQAYVYRQCRACGSAACDPMPDAETLARMYGPAYAEQDSDPCVEDPKSPQKTLDWLRQRPSGVFVDFGCGSGSLLQAATSLGWNAIGVEHNEGVVRDTEARTGCRVLYGLSALRGSELPSVDVIHMGDVIEHLTAPFEVVRDLVGLLRPGGWLMAQGPLEAGPCLFTAAVRAAAQLRPRRVTRMPPYHVLQATVRGQRAFFHRVGLTEVTYDVSEVAWPAPARLSITDIKQPRKLALFLLRRLSQLCSSLNPTEWGNRYFFIGAVGGGISE